MTNFIKKSEIKNNWVLINAENAIVGRLAAFISKVLRGKNKNQYTPNMDTGDFVIVTNIDKIKFTGKKFDNKKYYRHTGYPGGIKITTPSILLKEKPEKILKLAVKRMLPGGALAKKQIDVVTEKDHFVHVSGHPSKDELREMYGLARPKVAIPVHGEFIHTKAHAELATECGVPKVLQIENGLAVKLSEENFQTECAIAGFVKSGYFGVDGKQLLDLDGEIIRERRKLQTAGSITVSFAINDSLVLLSKPKVVCVGSYNLKADKVAQGFINDEIRILLKQRAQDLNLRDSKGLKFLKKKKSKLHEGKILPGIEKALRSRLLKIFEDLMGKRPVMEIMINLVD